MGNRNAIKLRPHVGESTTLMGLIGNGRCWHFDAWLYRVNDVYYLATQTRAGGRDLLQTNAYKLHLDRLSGAGALEYCACDFSLHEPITLQGRNLSPEHRDALNRLHWDAIRPMLSRRPNAFTSTSASFHYIRAPSLVPLEGAQNFFTYERI